MPSEPKQSAPNDGGPATPRPWRLETPDDHPPGMRSDAEIAFSYNPSIGVDGKRGVFTGLASIVGPLSQVQANAELIVRAVNAHDALVAALRGVADYRPSTRWKHGWCWCGGSLEHFAHCKAARAALALAEPRGTK